MPAALSHARPITAIALVFSLATAACAGESVRFAVPSPAAAATVAATPTPAPATPTPTADPNAACRSCWPLTGMPATDETTARRPLVVKIDNAPAARPHYGIAQADLVVEELVEGFVTRLVAIFHSRDAETIGGVRSARLADRSLTTMVRGALVYSGTSDYVWSLISKDAREGRYVELSADHSGGYYRVGFRVAPYNMFTGAKAQRDALAKLSAASADVPAWPFLAAADHAADAGGMGGASPAIAITIPYRADTSEVRYEYDARTRTYARWQNTSGKPVREVDAANDAPIAAANVIVIQTEIWEVPEIVDTAGAHAHDMRLTGTGRAVVFRDGLRQEATWLRPDDRAPFLFTSPLGDRILLSPGQTWIHIVPADWSVSSR